MAIAFKHQKVSSIPDDPAAAAAGEILPSDWNDDHDLTMATARLLGRVSSGAGAVEELTASQVATFLDLIKGTAAGNIPVLDGGGKLDTSVIPALALTEAFEVASQSAMLALTAQPGDIAIRTDLNKTFVLAASPASTLGNWKELRTPTDVVLAVAGLTGTITAAALKTALAIATTDISGFTANGRSLVNAADYAAMRVLLGLVIGTNVQAYDAATAKLNADQSWTGAQLSGTGTVLTSGTTITPTLGNWEGNRATLTLGHNATLANPSDIASMVGFTGKLLCKQDATGGRTLAFGSAWKPIGAAVAPSVPAGANALFRIDFDVRSATEIDFALSSVGV
jgi:hypothetical protein